MSDDVLVRVENVSKRFCRSLKRSLWYGLQDLGSELGGRRHGGGGGLPQSSADVELRKDEFWAVKDVSFELRRGECLGLIGRNGAGKTTLLRMLNGLIKPDTGNIKIKGKTGSLIALGAGFNPLLSGRENIYINAGILGMTKADISSRLDSIIDFSGVEKFIDSPVQSYSSGMQVRLGFAIAASASVDVLMIDEALAVGDIGFATKCMNRIAEINSRAAVIFVSHNMPMIARICSKTITLDSRNNQNYVEATQQGIARYYSLFQKATTGPSFDDELFNVKSVSFSPVNQDNSPEFMHGDIGEFNIEIQSKSPLGEILISSSIIDQSMNEIISFKDKDFMPLKVKSLASNPTLFKASLRSRALMLNAGCYSLALSIETKSTIKGSQTIHYQNNNLLEIVFKAPAPSSASVIETLFNYKS